ncbi:MAG: serine--tRNA ligase, partial [Candidatus Thorarchaeota archaeon]
MLDIKFIRENSDEIRENLKKRRNNEKLKDLERLIELDERVRKLKWESQKLRTQRNKLSREVGKLKKKGKDASEIIEKVNGINDSIEEIEKEAEVLEENLIQIQMRIPNILHESVPYGKDEEDNEVVSEWGGRPDPGFDVSSHVDLLETLDLADIPRAAKIAGSRFFFLKNELVFLDIAMQKLALEMLIDRGFSPIYPPFMMRRAPYEGVTDLADFGDVMYKIEGEDLYLIATSEHP